jgi:hypothetical protein
MDVPVHFKPGKRWLRPPRKPSVLGGGLLERARSTTLALLGVTTAVGLATVALALNQSWPLLADSPIPAAPSRGEAIGKATVAAQATVKAAGARLADVATAPRSNSSRAAGGGETGGAQVPQVPEVGSAPSPSAELVVAPSAPAEPQGDAPPRRGKPTPAPPPAGTTPQSPAPTAPEPAQPKPAPQSPPVVETAPATASEAPVDSSVPPWSNGKGHAYGRATSASDDHGHSAGDYDED